MNNWTELEDAERDRVWDTIYDLLKFSPYSDKKVSMPEPCIAYDISMFYNEKYRPEYNTDLQQCFIQWFRELTNSQDLYAFDWHMPAISFRHLRLSKKMSLMNG